MPIRPKNRSRYPADWSRIRAEILVRAEHRCERCGVRNGARIARGAGPDAGTYMTDDAQVFVDSTSAALGWWRMSDYRVDRMVTIVLTIAHLDHQPENCAPENLQALCQKCHLTYDAAHHAANARETRRSRKAAGDMFLETDA